jgi:two-component system chemotaxis response regulator CheB
MGRDGATGLDGMRKAGALTFGQTEDTCVVYGMPKVAFEIGAVAKQVPLQNMAAELFSALKDTR